MKKSFMFLPVAGLLVALTTAIASANENILLEENGFLAFEAETIAPVGDWQSTDQISGFTGSGYYKWTGPTVLSVAQAGKDTLVYHFRIANAGNYELRWRSRIAEGNNPTEHNDSWVRFATGSNVAGEQPINGWTKSYLNQLNTWSWQTTTVDNNAQLIRQHFSAGDHTIEISGRSNGHAIDRIVLFRYDDHSFNEESFNTAAVSASLSGPITLVEPEAPVSQAIPVSATEPLPIETSQAPVPSSPDNAVQNKNSLLTAEDSCSAGSVSLAAIADVYTQSGVVLNNDDLRLEIDNRVTYLRFDASQVPDNYSSVSLQLEVGTDNGDGTLAIYAGDHADWSEQTTAASDLPSATVLVGSETGQWNSQVRYTIPLDTALVANGPGSMLLLQESGNSDFSFKSSSTAAGARLVFNSSAAGFCNRYEDNLAGQRSEPELQSALNTTDRSDSTDQSGVASQSGGGGFSIALIMLLLVSNFAKTTSGHGRRPGVRSGLQRIS